MYIILLIILAILAFWIFVLIKTIQEKKKEDALHKKEHEVLNTFAQKVNEYLADDIIDRNEERELKKFIETLDISSQKLQESEGFKKFMQALVLRDLREGREFERIHAENLPILLGKNERVLWVEGNINGYERKTGSKYTAGSSGVSLKVCKGVYYRVGASKGFSTPYEYEKELGNGELIITSKAIYFTGYNQVKIIYSKILSFNPYSNGITITKDGSNPRPYTFTNLDPWFVINAMQLLADA